jgi:hypothetical protein
VGDFRALLSVAAYRTVTIPQSLMQDGLSEKAGYEICVSHASSH